MRVCRGIICSGLMLEQRVTGLVLDIKAVRRTFQSVHLPQKWSPIGAARTGKTGHQPIPKLFRCTLQRKGARFGMVQSDAEPIERRPIQHADQADDQGHPHKPLVFVRRDPRRQERPKAYLQKGHERNDFNQVPARRNDKHENGAEAGESRAHDHARNRNRYRADPRRPIGIDRYVGVGCKDRKQRQRTKEWRKQVSSSLAIDGLYNTGTSCTFCAC